VQQPLTAVVPAFSESVNTMSSINQLGGTGNAGPVQRVVTNPIQKQVPADAPKQLPATDKLELSGVSHLLKSLKNNDVRTDKVAIIKAQIEAGTYDDDKKLDVAVDRLLDDLLK
jgi:anti-sigma28 factor (negative regulator of flagellin synthesis)